MKVQRCTAMICTALLGVPGALALAQSFNSGITTGTLQNAAITEASGIAASRMNSGILWTHNDSGHPAQVFPITAAGANLGTYTIAGAGSTDWEDIAIGPGPMAGAQYIYIGDIGDNLAIRPSVAVYRVPEPTVSATQPPTNVSLSGAAKFTFVYPDGPRDAESLFVDPLTRDIYIISKRDTIKHLYRAAYPQSSSGTITLQLMTQFPTDSTWLTAADISPDGDQIIVRSTGDTSGRMYTRPAGGSITDAFNAAPTQIPLLAEAQGEAIGFDPQGWGYYTTSEGAAAPIHYFDRLPAHAVWIAGSGSFATASSWDIAAVPTAANSVHFGSTASGIGRTYAVNFGGDVASAVVIVHRDNVTWNLNASTYTQTGFAGVDSFVVGSAFGENATLTISNGTVNTGGASGVYSQIGRGAGSSGAVTVADGATWNNSPPLLIGRSGGGTLSVVAGGRANLSSVYIGGSDVTPGAAASHLSVNGGTIIVSGTLKVWNNGILFFSGGSLSASSLVLSGGGKAVLSAGGSKTLRAGSLSINSAAGSSLDLAGNAAIFDSTPLTTTGDQIRLGYAGGAWNGNGITSSSAAAAAIKTALGYAMASDVGVATFEGQPVNTNSVLVRYTLAGDANIDGKVDLADFTFLASNFNGMNKDWLRGDFNYDHTVDLTDFALLASNFNSTIPTSAAIVPEPIATMLLLTAAALIICRRRSAANPREAAGV